MENRITMARLLDDVLNYQITFYNKYKTNTRIIFIILVFRTVFFWYLYTSVI